MISTLLVAGPWLTTVALAGIVIVGPLLGWWLARRPRVMWVLAAMAMLVVLGLTLTPDDARPAAGCAVQWSLPRLGSVEVIANLILFVPPVLLAGVASRRPIVAALAGSGLSAVIEVLQALIPAIGRSCDTNDWLYNSLGAVLGALLAALALRLARRVRSTT